MGGGVWRRGLWGVARIVTLITSVVAGLIVDWLVGAGQFLVEPFDNIFNLDGRKAQVAVNWGLAALLYALVGGLIARLLRR